MELDCYSNFLAIVEAGSFTGASEIVHIAQPALSKQLKSLETCYGAKLILTNRGSRQLILTEAGKLLYQKAKYICSLEDLAHNEIDEIVGGAVGTLRISVANSRARLFISTTLRDFSKLYPQVNYEIYEGSIIDQSQQLLTGIAELGILSVPVVHEDSFEVLFRRREQLSVAYNKETIWLPDDDSEVSLVDLSGIPLSISIGCFDIVKGCCAKVGITPHILSVNSTRFTALQWAHEKTAIAIVPVEPGEFIGNNLIVKPISGIDVDLYKTIVKVKDRPLSAIAKKFIKFYAQKRDSEQVCDLNKILKHF